MSAGTGPEWGSLALVEEIALRGGGCALNTSSALVRLGVPAAAVGKVGGDTFGDFVLDLFDERSVERTGVIRDPSLPTSATVVLVSGDGERTFLHLPGANGRVRREGSTRSCSGHLVFAPLFSGAVGTPAYFELPNWQRLVFWLEQGV